MVRLVLLTSLLGELLLLVDARCNAIQFSGSELVINPTRRHFGHDGAATPALGVDQAFVLEERIGRCAVSNETVCAAASSGSASNALRRLPVERLAP